jgi:hypothetical protein
MKAIAVRSLPTSGGTVLCVVVLALLFAASPDRPAGASVAQPMTVASMCLTSARAATVPVAAAAASSCSTRSAAACACTSPESCQSLIATQLEAGIKRCRAAQWDCGALELAFDGGGCALTITRAKAPTFAACLQRELDAHRWPCLASTKQRIDLGSCTLL